MVTLLAKMNFFASGHPLSGFSAKSIGLKGSSDGNVKIAQSDDTKTVVTKSENLEAK
jgi:hypothetical protein